MLTAITLLYIIIKYVLTYLRTDNFSKQEYSNRKSTKKQIKLLIGAIFADTIITGIYFRLLFSGIWLD